MIDDAVELIKMNIDQSCDYNCEDCERYFECISSEKYQIYERGRMDIAARKLSKIKWKIMVLGGKGGVGKTTVAATIATTLALKGRNVCCVDSDFDSPSVPRMLGLKNSRLMIGSRGMIPVPSPFGVKVMSTGFFIKDADVITWYHDMRRGATEEFFANTDYGELDYLIVDLPPGTSSDSVNVMQYVANVTGAIIVTIASEVSQATARRCAFLCRKGGVPILGIIENMSGFTCPHCQQDINVLRFGGGEKLAKEMEIPFLGRIPLEQNVSDGSDEGTPVVIRAPESQAAKAFFEIVDKIENMIE